jgi:hypothetical protein
MDLQSSSNHDRKRMNFAEVGFRDNFHAVLAKRVRDATRISPNKFDEDFLKEDRSCSISHGSTRMQKLEIIRFVEVNVVDVILE